MIRLKRDSRNNYNHPFWLPTKKDRHKKKYILLQKTSCVFPRWTYARNIPRDLSFPRLISQIPFFPSVISQRNFTLNDPLPHGFTSDPLRKQWRWGEREGGRDIRSTFFPPQLRERELGARTTGMHSRCSSHCFQPCKVPDKRPRFVFNRLYVHGDSIPRWPMATINPLFPGFSYVGLRDYSSAWFLSAQVSINKI